MNVPPGWAEATLGGIGEYLNGRGFKKSEWRETGRPIIRIQNLTGTSDRFNYFEGEHEERYTARSGDLLVSWAATLGVFVWKGPEAVVNQHIFKVRSHIDRGFHRYLLLSVLEDLRRQTHGSGMVHITKNRFEQTRVAIPPLAEQRRIVVAIEEHFSRLDAADDVLARARRRLATLRVSSVAAACNGWPERALGEIAQVYVGTTPSRTAPELWRGDVPWVSSGEVAFCRIRQTRETISPAAVTSPERLHPPGTVLLAMIGEGKTRGQAAILDVAATHNQNSAAIHLDRSICTPEWLFYVLMARYEETRRAGSGAQQPALNRARVQALRIPLPPLEDQESRVADLELQLSIVHAMTDEIDRAILRSASLGRSILEYAFTGRLVPQDPSDAPASSLLERIAAERADALKPSRRKRKIPA
jgi:type I restriction enzyme, S subunit